MPKQPVPDYLKKPTLEGHKYGRLVFDEGTGKFWILDGEPFLMEFAKRVFPGAAIARSRFSFGTARKEVSDLNWLLLRFPMEIECKAILNKARKEVVEQVQKRATGDDLIPTSIPAEFTGKLYRYQEEGVSFMITNKRCLLGDGMGLGKTWTSLGAAAAVASYPVLIVCQTHVQKQWQRVIGSLFDMSGDYNIKHYDTPFDIVCKRGEALAPILRTQTPYKIAKTPFAIIHYGLLAYWGRMLRKKKYPVVIFDEVQELRHTGSAKYTAASLLSDDANYVWGLSGSPIYGYGKEMWSVTNALEFHCLGSEEAFTREWCVGYGEKIVEDPKALHGHLAREGLLLRRKAEDVAVDLPKVVRHVQDLGHDELLYDELIANARAKAEEYEHVKYFIKGRLARDIERDSRKAAGVSKAAYVAEFVVSLIEAGEIPLVYAWHHDVHDIIIERLKRYKPAVLTGRESEKKKDLALKRFMNGETKVALLSLRSASGLDGLQYRATCCVFAELDWSPSIHSQCETRIARIGVDEKMAEVPSYYCVSRVGHDEVILDVLGVKVGQFVGIMGDEPDEQEDKQVSEEKAVKRIKKLVEKLKKEKDNNMKMVNPDGIKKCKSKLGIFARRLKNGRTISREISQD
jgi:SNF2 family DNA or RNA helicase